MIHNRFKFTLLVIGFLTLLAGEGCSPPQEAEQKKKEKHEEQTAPEADATPGEGIERRTLPIFLSLDYQSIQSKMFIEFPLKEYDLSVGELVRKRGGLSPVEKELKARLICRREWTYDACKDSFKNENGNSYSREKLKKILNRDPDTDKFFEILRAIHVDNTITFIMKYRNAEGKERSGHIRFREIHKNKFGSAGVDISIPLGYAYDSATIALKNTEAPPISHQDVEQSLGPDSIRFVVSFEESKRKAEDIPKEQQVVFYLKGRPLYLNILDKAVDKKLLEENPALAFYRRYLQTVSSGTKEEILNFYAESNTLEKMKKYFERATEISFDFFQKDTAKEESEIRFMIDADPFYLIIYARRKGPSPDKELWKLATIYKTPKDGYKIANVNLGNSLTDFLFETDFKKRVLKPMIMKHFYRTQK